MALIVGVKHYRRTLKNIDDRVTDLKYLHSCLRVTTKTANVEAMKRSVERALKRYDEIDKIIVRLLRYYADRNARLKRKVKIEKGEKHEIHRKTRYSNSWSRNKRD